MARAGFVNIDITGKTIASLDRNIRRENTKVATVDSPDGLLVLHVIEQDARSLAPGEKSGALAIGVAGDGEVYVVFG